MPIPQKLLLQDADKELVRQALEELPAQFREVLVLRERGPLLQGDADVVGIPLGTVMSGLARARKWLRQSLMKTLAREP